MLLTDKDLLRKLVSFDTRSSLSNLPLADFICDYLDRPGVTIDRQPGPDGSKVNVIAIVGPDGSLDNGTAGTVQDRCKGLVLSGHMDVVPADEPQWNGNPFRLKEVNGTYVGRGSCDMKGSIALAMNVFAGTDPARLGQPLALLLTYDEELGSLGAQHFVRSWPADRPLPVNVIVGEPTSLRAVRMHKGHLWMRVTAHGTAAHSGSPHRGHSAIEAGARIVKALSNLATVFKQKRSDYSRFFSTVPFTVLNVGQIHGGTAINVIPDRCVIDLGVRLLPGMNTEASIEWVKDAVIKADPKTRITVEVMSDNPPLLVDDDAAVHQALCTELGQTQSFGVSYASDGGKLSAMGMQCVLFGPGSIEVAHKPNEFVPIDEFTRAGEVIERLVRRFCMSRDPEPAA